MEIGLREQNFLLKPEIFSEILILIIGVKKKLRLTTKK